jgi:muramoyltetrapeptide carboxypeptidase
VTTFPPSLRPGDLVVAIAPSSPFEAALGWRGLGVLRERYRVRFDRAMFARRGYLAGTDDRRHDELARALVDPEVRAIVSLRGGYGASRFASRLPWDALVAHPKWLVGFSDVTALHVEAQRVGVASIHGPNVTALGRRSDAITRLEFFDALEHPSRGRRFDRLDGWVDGVADGVLVGGNLTLLHACAAAGRLALPPHSLLFLEDVTERPYRIDRMLTTLLDGGHLRAISGVILGDFTDCSSGPDRVTVHQVLRERLALLGVPVACGLPCGHDPRNVPIVLGSRARLVCEGSAAFLDLGEHALR